MAGYLTNQQASCATYFSLPSSISCKHSSRATAISPLATFLVVDFAQRDASAFINAIAIRSGISVFTIGISEDGMRASAPIDGACSCLLLWQLIDHAARVLGSSAAIVWTVGSNAACSYFQLDILPRNPRRSCPRRSRR